MDQHKHEILKELPIIMHGDKEVTEIAQSLVLRSLVDLCKEEMMGEEYSIEENDETSLIWVMKNFQTYIILKIFEHLQKAILTIVDRLEKGILEHGEVFPMKNAVKNALMEIMKIEKLAEFEELFSMDFKEF